MLRTWLSLAVLVSTFVSSAVARADGGAVVGGELAWLEQMREGDPGETGAEVGEESAAIEEWVHRERLCAGGLSHSRSGSVRRMEQHVGSRLCSSMVSESGPRRKRVHSPIQHRSRYKSRLSLRERPAFRGAKGDNQTVIPRTILSGILPAPSSLRATSIQQKDTLRG